MLTPQKRAMVAEAISSVYTRQEVTRQKEKALLSKIQAFGSNYESFERFELSIELVDVQATLQSLENSLAKLHSFIAPVRVLPNEILSYIFIAGMEDDLQKEYEQKQDILFRWDPDPTKSFPELVSQICSHWRTVALDTPSLWTVIRFSDQLSKNEREKLWLQRSKAALIRDMMIPAITKTPFSQLVEYIKPYLPRVVSLRLAHVPHKTLHRFLEQLPPSLPHLELLSAQSPGPGHDDHKTYPLTLTAEQAPNLRILATDQLSYEWGTFAFDNLTKLWIVVNHMCHLSTEDLDHILSKVGERLEWFCLNIEESADRQDQPEMAKNPIPMPRLHTLEFHEEAPRILDHLITHYTFPVLRTLYLVLYVDNDEENNIEFWHAISGKNPPILLPFTTVETLVLNTIMLSTAEIQFVITRAFPNLTTFCTTDDFEERHLNKCYRALKLCPKLTRLRLAGTTGKLKRLITDKKKFTNSEPIKYIELESDYYIRRELLQWVRDNVETVVVKDESQADGYGLDEEEEDDSDNPPEGGNDGDEDDDDGDEDDDGDDASGSSGGSSGSESSNPEESSDSDEGEGNGGVIVIGASTTSSEAAVDEIVVEGDDGADDDGWETE